jgi:hypothetical protein
VKTTDQESPCDSLHTPVEEKEADPDIDEVNENRTERSYVSDPEKLADGINSAVPTYGELSLKKSDSVGLRDGVGLGGI